MAAMLVYLDKRILNIFFWKYTNMAANFFVVLIPRDWVKTLYWYTYPHCKPTFGISHGTAETKLDIS